MRGLGFACARDEVGNVIGDIGTGDGPTVMLLSHLDTVDRPLAGRAATATGSTAAARSTPRARWRR